jgi:hypothetical protein
MNTANPAICGACEALVERLRALAAAAAARGPDGAVFWVVIAAGVAATLVGN